MRGAVRATFERETFKGLLVTVEEPEVGDFELGVPATLGVAVVVGRRGLQIQRLVLVARGCGPGRVGLMDAADSRRLSLLILRVITIASATTTRVAVRMRSTSVAIVAVILFCLRWPRMIERRLRRRAVREIGGRHDGEDSFHDS